MATLLDTDCLLRYLLEDIPKQADAVAGAIRNGACTAPEFLAECAYVLSGSVYGFSRRQTADALLALLEEIDCDHHLAMRRAAELFGEGKFDFSDCILAGRHEIEDIPVMTFDKKLLRLLSSTGKE